MVKKDEVAKRARKGKLTNFLVYVTPKTLRGLDQMVRELGYCSRSEFIRTALTQIVEEHQAKRAEKSHASS